MICFNCCSRRESITILKKKNFAVFIFKDAACCIRDNQSRKSFFVCLLSFLDK